MKGAFSLRKIPVISENIVIRKEYFGGLIFNKETMSVFEINRWTFDLLKLADGKKSLGDIVAICSKILKADINEVKIFLNRLRTEGFIQW